VEYDSRFLITSTSQTSSATGVAYPIPYVFTYYLDIVNSLAVAVPAAGEQFARIWINVLYFGAMAICDSNGECECTPNFVPPSCETSALCMNNCTSHGTCIDGSLGRVCSCDDGYTGRDCSTLNCPNACSGQGSCFLQSGAAPVCVCEQGWIGDACNISTFGLVCFRVDY
jgi:hypothetical protein